MFQTTNQPQLQNNPNCTKYGGLLQMLPTSACSLPGSLQLDKSWPNCSFKGGPILSVIAWLENPGGLAMEVSSWATYQNKWVISPRLIRRMRRVSHIYPGIHSYLWSDGYHTSTYSMVSPFRGLSMIASHLWLLWGPFLYVQVDRIHLLLIPPPSYY